MGRIKDFFITRSFEGSFAKSLATYLFSNFHFNIFSLQILSPLILITCIYIKTSMHMIFIIIGLAILLSAFSNMMLNKFLLFAIIGLLRGYYFENATEHYTYKRTTFSANVVDLKVKEHGIYVELTNFAYHHDDAACTKYNKIDTAPVFPSNAQMRIAKIDKEQEEAKKELDETNCGKKTHKKKPFHFSGFEKISTRLVPGSRIFGIGRFLLPTPGAIFEKHQQKLPSGLLDEFIIDETTGKNTTFKTYLRKTYDWHLSKTSAQFAKAILLGDTFAINSDVRNKFQEAGIAHLLGVSVLNIAILGLIFYFVIRKLFALLFYKTALFISLDIVGKIGAIIVVGIYCYLVGFEYPLLRSLLMSSFAIIALYFGRNRNKETLLWAAACILLINPLAIYNIGFELSFGAVLGLCCAPNIGAVRIENTSNKIVAIATKCTNILLKSFYSTFFASSIILPISLYQFHTTSIQPFLANLVAIPFVSLIVTPISFIASIMAMLKLEMLQNFFMILLDHAFIIFNKIAMFFEPIGMNFHIDPIAGYGCLIFILTMVLFACFNGILKYLCLICGIGALATSAITRAKPPLLLIHPYAIGLVLDDKIVVYPKCNFITNIWEQAYNRKCIDGKNIASDKQFAHAIYFQKEKCGKIVVLGKIGLIFQELKGTSEIFTNKNYVIPYGQQMQQMTRIQLNMQDLIK